MLRWWLGNRQWREPARSDRLPVHRSESPTGYSSASCSPAEPASASPVTDNLAPIPIRRLAVMPRRAGRVRRHRVSSLLCAPGDISTLRRQNFHAGGRGPARKSAFAVSNCLLHGLYRAKIWLRWGLPLPQTAIGDLDMRHRSAAAAEISFRDQFEPGPVIMIGFDAPFRCWSLCE